MGKRKPNSGSPEGESKPLKAEATPAKKVTIIIRLPEVKAKLKEIVSQLARRHNRDLTGEVIQALEEYAQKYHLWPEEPGQA